MNSIKLSELTDLVGFCDPSSGKTNVPDGADNAIVIVGQTIDGRTFALDEWVERAATDTITRRILEYNARWRCKRFGVDATGQQHLYFDMLSREASLRRERIALIPREFTVAEGSKQFRITTTIQRWMHNGLLFVGRNCTTLLRQLERYPTGMKCDAVDALAGALSLLRDPLASQAKLEYDTEYDEEQRFRNAVRKDPRYGAFKR
jgi:predicted phage terminase large subunit-like protein